jgi:hypothetical protein
MSVRVGVAEEQKAVAIQEIKGAMIINKDFRMHETYQMILILLLNESNSRWSRISFPDELDFSTRSEMD